jgi:hypothetical protein
MSDEPSFDFLPWEELPVGVRRNRKKMYNYLVSVLNGDEPGPTPPGPTPTGTGTVTVTCLNLDEDPALNRDVTLSSVEQVTDPQTELICAGNTGDTGTVTLKEFDWTLDPPLTDITANVPYGNYYLIIGELDDPEYTGTLTVDGNETVTITLTSE